MKKPTLKKRLKCHDSMVAPPTNSLGDSKLPGSPKCSTKLGNTEMWGKGKLFVTVLKIFFLVLVAAVTNRTVVSLSMSAFSLFFVEHVVKYLYGLYKNLFVSQTIKTTASFSSIEGDNNSTGDSLVSDCSSLNISGEEMQDVQADFDSDIRVLQNANSDHNKRLSFGDVDTRERVLENDENCNGEGTSTNCNDEKRRGYRREKVKSKFKKLLPSKLRKSMKRRRCSKSEKPAGSMEEINFEVKECINELDDKKENTCSVPASEPCQPMQSDSEESVVEAKPQKPTDRITLILDYWFISFIVVAGLVEGQNLAIVLTTGWCLIMKLVARMQMKK